MTRPSKLWLKLNQIARRVGKDKDWFLIPMAAIIGALAGLVATGFGTLVHTSEHIFFAPITGHDLHAPHYWLLIALPMAGGLIVGTIKSIFRLPLIAHGTTDVIEALAKKRGVMPLRAGIFGMVNPAFTIGSGGSAGAEGPIIQIGSVLGSTIGQILRAGRLQMNTLIGCGAAASVAAIFHAPMAGVLFVLEVVLRDFSLKTFMPVVIASIFGVAVNDAMTADHIGGLFALPRDAAAEAYRFTLMEVVPCIFLGIGCGMIGCLFTVMLHKSGEWGSKLALPTMVKPAIGGLMLGLVGVGFVSIYPAVLPDYQPPAFFGNGYPVIEWLLSPQAYESGALTFGFLILALVGKLIGTSMTLGTGGHGGAFAPSLFVGVTFGGMFGMGIRDLGFFADIRPDTYALAGMAGVMGGVMHCPLTACIMIFELTRDYTVILPVMLAAITATIVAQQFMQYNFFSLALRDKGIRIGSMSDMTILRTLETSQVPLVPAVTVMPSDPAQRLIDLAEKYSVHDFVVVNDKEEYEGMIIGEDIRTTLLEREAVPLLVVSELMHRDLPTVNPDETLDGVLDKFSLHDVSSLAVVDTTAERPSIVGMITRTRLMRKYQEALSLG